MSANTVEAKLNATPNTFRGPTLAIWGDCPWLDLVENPGLGMTFFDDFIACGTAAASGAVYQGTIGNWSTYMYQGAQINDGLLEGGVVRIGSDGDNEGVALLQQGGTYRFLTTSTLALNQKMWFECRVAKSSIASAHMEFFCGLMKPTLSSGLPAAAQPITTTDDTLMTAGDLFGFHSSGGATRGGPTEVAVAFELASGTINYPTNLTTLMASTGNTVLAANAFVKLGWIYDPSAQVKTVVNATARQTVGAQKKALIRFFVNGVEAPTFLTSDDVVNSTATQAFPTAFMCPTIAMMNQTSQSSDYLAVDWIRVAQLANS